MRRWWIQVARYAFPQGRSLLLFFLLIFVGDAVNVLKPWPLKLIIDCVLKGDPLPNSVSSINMLPGGSSTVGLLGWFAAGTVLLFMFHQTILGFQNYVRAGVGKAMMYNLGSIIFDRLQRLSFRFHGRQRSGDLVRRVMTDSGCVSQLMMDILFPALTSLISLCIMFFIMWNLDPALSLTAILIAPMHALLIRLFNRPMMERTWQQEKLEGEMMALAEQTLTAIPIVQAFNRVEYEKKRWEEISQITLKAHQRNILAQMYFKIGVSGATAFGMSVVMLIGGIKVLEGNLTVGSLIVFLSYVASLYGPMETLSYLSHGYASAAARARRVLEVLETDEKVSDSPDAKPLAVQPQKAKGFVHLERVTFGYESGYPVLKDITVKGCPGETVALVGPTGSGKTTLVSLIMRLFDPWQGRVSIDGMDLRNVKLVSVRSNVSLVLQEPFMLPITIKENIAYGRPGASDDEIIDAAVMANAHPFIMKLPQRYDTNIGELGSTLSGGQRQLLSIARAFLKNAPILILDEPTSALDAETEERLFAALKLLSEDRTTFVITHRLSTIRRADRVVVLVDGKVVEVGTHKQLMDSENHYRTLCDLQQIQLQKQ
jgi:ATP-binding cassette, subfamily B, bacterial